MMRSLSNEVSRRARVLLKRDGHKGKALAGGHYLGRVLELASLTLSVSVEGTLLVEQTYSGIVIYNESPTGVILSTSRDNILERTIDELQQFMILEDMSDV